MEALLGMFTIPEILMFLVLFSLAVKGVVSFFDWAIPRLKKALNKDENEKEAVQERLDKGSHFMHDLEANQLKLSQNINDLTIKMDMLMESDRDSIKSFLTKEHHYYCYEVGWIDDYSLECCERRYKHYKDEGGNSFIGGFMEDLRNLPTQPPSAKKVDK